MKKETKKIEKVINKKLIIPFLGLALISFISYIVIELIYNNDLSNSLGTFLSMIIIFLFMTCFIIVSLKNDNKKSMPFIIIGTILIITYSAFNILAKLNIINIFNKEYVLNFYNTPITEVYSWREKNQINIKETYEYSDLVPMYYVISQDVSYMTPTKDVREINLTISLGPNYEKEVVVPNFMGWMYDDVIKYLEDNYLNNIELSFQESNNLVNTVIFQEGSGSRKRNDLIKLTFSKDEVEPIEIIDFTNTTTLYATSWLKKHGFKYEINYEFHDNIRENYVIKQNLINTVSDPITDTIVLDVSKGKMIKAPDFTEMSQEEINKWIMENNLKVNYNEVYNDSITLGDVISTDVIENDIIEAGGSINITISKGKLEMIGFKSINDFITWANKYSIKYEIKNDYSESIPKDNVISSSHKEGDIIKDDDVVIITISKGKSITIPSFVGMSKTNIQNKCTELNLNCSFTYGGYTESTKKDIATKQSKKQGLVVAENTNVIITLSSGLYIKVTVPSFTGKTKEEITNTCKKLGITCNYTYQSNYSSTSLNTCVSQSKSGVMIQGSTISITLSKGPAKTYNVIIDANQLSNGNPSATKATLQSKLSAACPGVTFVYKFQVANSGIGYLAPTSEVKVGSNTLIQGQTYNVIINSN